MVPLIGQRPDPALPTLRRGADRKTGIDPCGAKISNSGRLAHIYA